MALIEALTAQQTAAQGIDLFSQSENILGKEDFLKLLVAQLEHQDPLSPMENEAFVAQLAQFSSLEQLQNMNESLQQFTNTNTYTSQIMASTFAGKTVCAYGNSVHLNSDGPAELRYRLSDDADRLTVTVYDVRGQEVRTFELSGGSRGDGSLLWDGKDAHGKRMPSGDYTLSFSAMDAEENELPVQGIVSGAVEKVIYENGEVYLLVNGGRMPLSHVLDVSE